MGEDANVGWSEGRPIEIVVPVELGVGGQLWVDSGSAQEI